MHAAALDLFTERGYSATPMQAIADRAGVAVQTLYFTFGTKRALLTEMLDVAVAGDQEPVATMERPWFAAMVAEPDPARQLRLQVEAAREIYERVSPVLAVMRGAATADPEIADLWETNTAQRTQVQERLVAALAGKAALRDGMDVATANDIAVTLQSPELYQLLTDRRGWTPRRWETWIGDTLIAQLLDPERPGPPTEGSR